MSPAIHRLLTIPALAIACALALVGTSVAAPAAMRNLRAGDRIGALRLAELRQGPRTVTLGSPTVIIFWATWAPESVAALKEIVAAIPACPIHWDLMPINVDDPSPGAGTARRIDSVAHAVGYGESIWFDKDLKLSRRWGVGGLPGIVIAAYGGVVETITHGWTAPVRKRIVAGYLGATADTSVSSAPDSAAGRCRRDAALARTLWERGRGDSAIAMMRRIVSVCPDDANPWIFLARWHWALRDSAAAARAADSAIALDAADPWGWTTAGEIASWLGDFEHAREHARRAVACDSGFAPGWGLLAWSAMETGDDSTAERAVALLRRLDRNDPRMAMVQACLWELKGDLRRAASAWRDAVGRRLRADRDPVTGLIWTDRLHKPSRLGRTDSEPTR